MKITLLFTGKTKPDFLDQGVRQYVERTKHFTPLQVVEVQDLKKTKGIPQQKVMEQEGDKILKIFEQNDFVILLDERGKQLSSVELAGFIEEKALQSARRVVFVIGGAYGFHKNVYDRADMLLSVSKMTFSHQVIRLLFLEQLYRAYTLIKGQPYHHG